MKFRPMLTLLVLSVLGCSTAKLYEGEKRADNEIARIEGSTYFWGIASQTMGLCEVDGKHLINADDWSKTPQYAVEILPGSHELVVCYSRTNASKTVRSPFQGRFTMALEAGHKYKIDFKTDTYVYIWMDDENTGERVWKTRTLPPFPM